MAWGRLNLYTEQHIAKSGKGRQPCGVLGHSPLFYSSNATTENISVMQLWLDLNISEAKIAFTATDMHTVILMNKDNKV